MPLKKSYGITAPVNLGNGMPFAVRNSFFIQSEHRPGYYLGALTMCSEATLYDPDFTGVERNRSTLTK